jgi:hypothetical protein
LPGLRAHSESKLPCIQSCDPSQVSLSLSPRCLSASVISGPQGRAGRGRSGLILLRLSPCDFKLVNKHKLQVPINGMIHRQPTAQCGNGKRLGTIGWAAQWLGPGSPTHWHWHSTLKSECTLTGISDYLTARPEDRNGPPGTDSGVVCNRTKRGPRLLASLEVTSSSVNSQSTPGSALDESPIASQCALRVECQCQ